MSRTAKSAARPNHSPVLPFRPQRGEPPTPPTTPTPLTTAQRQALLDRLGVTKLTALDGILVHIAGDVEGEGGAR
jgi:hypothetical protein